MNEPVPRKTELCRLSEQLYAEYTLEQEDDRPRTLTEAMDRLADFIERHSSCLSDPLMIERLERLIEAEWKELLSRRPTPSPGDTVNIEEFERSTDGYRLIRVIGKGGEGIVYEGITTDGLNHRRAVKLLNSSGSKLMQSNKLRAKFRLEGFSHPNVTHIHAAGESQFGPFIAAEFVEGEDLHAWLANDGGKPRVVEERVAARIALVLAWALAAVHNRGINHLDLKPANILGCTDPLDPGKLKISDFGISRLRNEPIDVPMGTIGFMPPEQYVGLTDQRSDIFSLGLLILHAIRTPQPVGTDTRKGTARLFSTSQLRDVGLDRESLGSVEPNDRQVFVTSVFKLLPFPDLLSSVKDPVLKLILSRCIELNPADRYQSADELCRDLKEWTEFRPVTNVDYVYSKKERLWMLIHRCKRFGTEQDATKLWGLVSLGPSILGMLLSLLCTILLINGYEENLSRKITSCIYVYSWIVSIAVTCLFVGYSENIRKFSNFILMLIISFLLIDFVFFDRPEVDRDAIRLITFGVIGVASALQTRYWLPFAAFGVISTALGLIHERYDLFGLNPAYGPLLIGWSQGLCLIYYGVRISRLGPSRPNSQSLQSG